MDKKVSGVMIDTALDKDREKQNFERTRDDIHEITLNTMEEEEYQEPEERTSMQISRRKGNIQ